MQCWWTRRVVSSAVRVILVLHQKALRIVWLSQCLALCLISMSKSVSRSSSWHAAPLSPHPSPRKTFSRVSSRSLGGSCTSCRARSPCTISSSKPCNSSMSHCEVSPLTATLSLLYWRRYRKRWRWVHSVCFLFKLALVWTSDIASQLKSSFSKGGTLITT